MFGLTYVRMAYVVKVKLAVCLTKHHNMTYHLIKHHSIKSYWEVWGIAQRVFKIITRWSGQSHPLAALPLW